ncbi:MAG: CDP-alcohol phosphatidyltransferase family protein [Vibrio sp.]
MFDRKILDLTKKPLDVIAQRLQKFGLNPNQITWCGFVFGMVAALLIAINQMYLAIIFILLNRLADGLDGAMARQSNPTDCGAFLDITLDFLFYSAIPVAFAFNDPTANALPAVVLIYSFIGTSCSFLAFAILAAKRGLNSSTYPRKGFYYLGGLTEASETIVVFILMCSIPYLFYLFSYGFAILCFITTVTRITAAYNIFNED